MVPIPDFVVKRTSHIGTQETGIGVGRGLGSKVVNYKSWGSTRLGLSVARDYAGSVIFVGHDWSARLLQRFSESEFPAVDAFSFLRGGRKEDPSLQ